MITSTTDKRDKTRTRMSFEAYASADERRHIARHVRREIRRETREHLRKLRDL
jgi:hypothetical protein